MIINITGKNIKVGQALNEHIHEKIQKTVVTYLKEVIRVDIILEKHSYLFFVKIIMHESVVGVIQCVCNSNEIYDAFDIALTKIEKQLRKYKAKISSKKIRFHKDEDILAQEVQAKKYTLSPDNENLDEHEHESVIIAEKATFIEQISVSEAVMRMDLRHLPALLFLNKANGRLNLVYHRQDGNIAWIDPDIKHIKP